MEGKLLEAACKGDLCTLYHSAVEDPAIFQKLHSYARSPDTPLHLASMFGQVDFVREYIKLSSITTRQLCRLNRDGYNPLHLAAANGHVEIVKHLLECSSGHHQLGMMRDRDGRTALHCAVAAAGDVDVIDVLFARCPGAAMEVTTDQGESVLHLAVKHHHFEALEFLIEKLGPSAAAYLLNLGDREGNTVLHLATAGRQLQIVEYLIKLPSLDVNAENLYHLRALDMASLSASARAFSSHNDSYVDPAIFSSQTGPTNIRQTVHRNIPGSSSGNEGQDEEHEKRDWLKEMRSGIMVMASLIATLTFQVALSPPGGVWQDSGPDIPVRGSIAPAGHKPGKSILYDLDRNLYSVLMFLNANAFLASITTIVGLLKPFRISSVRQHMVGISVKVTVLCTTAEFFTILLLLAHKSLLLQPLTMASFIFWLVVLGGFLIRFFLETLGKFVRSFFPKNIL